MLGLSIGTLDEVYCSRPVLIIVEREVSNFHMNCALSDKSMTLSAFVLRTFLITKSMLANAIFFIFKMATMISKMAAKLTIFLQIKTDI